jgi:hypothetical protein
MGVLTDLFDRGTGGRCHKWRHYFEIYERYLDKFAGSNCTYLEIGVNKGGSLEIMAQYLGSGAKIVGVDVDPKCASPATAPWTIHIGNQADARFLAQVVERSGPFDVIVDDGGHTPDQQITSFFSLFPHLNYGGVYLVEDLHTTFWHGYQDSRYGINFYDYAKGLVDKLSLWNMEPGFFERYHLPHHKREGAVSINNFATNQIFGIHFYDSVIVIEKRKIAEPLSEMK